MEGRERKPIRACHRHVANGTRAYDETGGEPYHWDSVSNRWAAARSERVCLLACTSLSGQQWTPSSSGTPGTPIGGYSASRTSGSVKPLPAKTSSTYTLYWVCPANSVNATYQYTMSGGGSNVSSPVATATFNITGPTSGTMISRRSLALPSKTGAPDSSHCTRQC
jgi:hypothetical protein